MAQTSTVHTFDLTLSDVDRGVYQTLALKLARHPSETADHLVTHDAYLAQVKPASQVAEPWDYEKILKTIPADQAFNPPSGDCHL